MWATAKRADEHDLPEREVTTPLADFASVWTELFPAEQARIVQLLVERVDVVSRVLRLTLLAPDIVERIMDGQTVPGLAEFLRPLSAQWGK